MYRVPAAGHGLVSDASQFRADVVCTHCRCNDKVNVNCKRLTLAKMTSQLANNSVFYDEEDCLGFGVFVAELELIIGTSRDRRPDQVQLLELLQKLEASISTTDSSTLKQHQKRCEAALYDIIYKGACTVVSMMSSMQRKHPIVCCSSTLYYTTCDSHGPKQRSCCSAYSFGHVLT